MWIAVPKWKERDGKSAILIRLSSMIVISNWLTAFCRGSADVGSLPSRGGVTAKTSRQKIIQEPANTGIQQSTKMMNAAARPGVRTRPK